MKKVYSFIVLGAIIAAASCNNATETKTTTTETTTTTTKDAPPPPAAPQPEGMVLMSKSDCATCHQLDAKVVGPSYKEIAAKYPNTAENVSKLASSIIKGAVGTWGTVPMPSHAAVAQADAEKMAGYILSLRDQK